MGVNKYSNEDAIYLKLLDTEYCCGQTIDNSRYIDLDNNGDVLGIGFLNVSFGVELEGVPKQILPEVNKLLKETNIKIL